MSVVTNYILAWGLGGEDEDAQLEEISAAVFGVQEGASRFVRVDHSRFVRVDHLTVGPKAMEANVAIAAVNYANTADIVSRLRGLERSGQIEDVQLFVNKQGDTLFSEVFRSEPSLEEERIAVLEGELRDYEASMAKANARIRELEEEVEILGACKVCGAGRGPAGSPLCECPDPAAGLASRIRELEGLPLTPFERMSADRLADAVASLVTRRLLDSRSEAADALLDYRDPPRTPRSDRLAELEGILADQGRVLFLHGPAETHEEQAVRAMRAHGHREARINKLEGLLARMTHLLRCAGSVYAESAEYADQAKALVAEARMGETEAQAARIERLGEVFEGAFSRFKALEAVIAPLLPLFRGIERDWRQVTSAPFPHPDTILLTAEFPTAALRALVAAPTAACPLCADRGYVPDPRFPGSARVVWCTCPAGAAKRATTAPADCECSWCAAGRSAEEHAESGGIDESESVGDRAERRAEDWTKPDGSPR